MKYVCNECSKIIQADDITIHYATGENGLEIIAICPSCLVKYLNKTKGNSDIKEDEDERMKMKRKW